MPESSVKFESVWVDTTPTPVPEYPALAGDVTVDVCVVGAGIAGLTTAAILAWNGKKVAVVDAAKVGMGDSGYTTAFLTTMLDEPYSEMAKTVGADTTRAIAQATLQSIDTVEALSEKMGIDCDFVRENGYLFSPTGQDEAFLQEECAAAVAAGLPASITRDVPLPFPAKVALRFERQGQFHPRKYLLGIARWLAANGQRVHEQTNVTTVTPRGADGYCRVQTDKGLVRAKYVVLCTSFPFFDDAIAAQVTPVSTYVYGAIPQNQGQVRGLFVDTEHPYHYLRSHPLPDGRDVLIVGGEDHKAGEGDADEKFANLQKYVESQFPLATLTYRWSGVVFERPHAIPYIGKSAIGEGVRTACAFAGNGMTGGTIAGQVLSDAILGKENAYAAVYAAPRA